MTSAIYKARRTQSIAARREDDSAVWTWPYSCLALYMLCYYFSPEDYFPALESIPFYKLLAGAALAFTVARNVRKGRSWLTLPAEMRWLVPLLLLMLVNIVFSNWPGGSAEIFHGRVVKTALLAILIANAIETARQYRYMLILMVASGAFLGLYVINSYFEGNITRYGRPLGYGYKEFGNPNDLALGLLILMPFAYILLRGQKDFFARAAYACALVALVAGVLVTQSRMGMLGLILLAAVWFYALGKSNILKLMLAMTVVGATVAVTVSAFPALGNRFASIFDASRDPNQSRGYRLQHMWDGVLIIADRPLIGVGMGQSAEVIGRKHFFGAGHWERIHSLYVEFAAELGIPALMVFLALLVGVMRQLAKVSGSLENEPGCARLVPYLQSARVSLYSFAIVATFAPASYSWVPYILIGLSCAALAITRRNATSQPENAFAERDRVPAARVLIGN